MPRSGLLNAIEMQICTILSALEGPWRCEVRNDVAQYWCSATVQRVSADGRC